MLKGPSTYTCIYLEASMGRCSVGGVGGWGGGGVYNFYPKASKEMHIRK